MADLEKGTTELNQRNGNNQNFSNGHNHGTNVAPTRASTIANPATLYVSRFGSMPLVD